MKWAVVENDVITNIYQGPQPPEGSHPIPEELNPFKISWDGEKIVSYEHTLSDEDVAGINRDIRNRKLVECDWTQLPDTPLSTKEAWATYRQGLRDLPNHVNWPKLSDSDWPVPPEG